MRQQVERGKRMTEPGVVLVSMMVTALLGGFAVAGWVLLALVLRDHGLTIRDVLSDREKKKFLVVLVSLVVLLAPAFGLMVGRGVGEMVISAMTGQ
ncbi:MAG: hypothetical protein D6694_09585 [Gammaproteobacteria bacterium]|nr:MAG: hypothetical protein D6694_09585 [Gammaproteobacteria bacterium]